MFVRRAQTTRPKNDSSDVSRPDAGLRAVGRVVARRQRAPQVALHGPGLGLRRRGHGQREARDERELAPVLAHGPVVQQTLPRADVALRLARDVPQIRARVPELAHGEDVGDVADVAAHAPRAALAPERDELPARRPVAPRERVAHTDAVVRREHDLLVEHLLEERRLVDGRLPRGGGARCFCLFFAARRDAGRTRARRNSPSESWAGMSSPGRWFDVPRPAHRTDRHVLTTSTMSPRRVGSRTSETWSPGWKLPVCDA